MAKPLRIGTLIDVDRPLGDTVAQLQRFADAGLDHAFAVQIFGPDALTLLAAAGSQVPGIGLGTGVVPVYPRHPMMLAQQALTVQWATANRLLLGIGLSHQVVVENMWGMSFDRPAGLHEGVPGVPHAVAPGRDRHQSGRTDHDQRVRPGRCGRRVRAAGAGRRTGPGDAEACRHGCRRHHHLDDGHRERSPATSRRRSPPRRKRPGAPRRA